MKNDTQKEKSGGVKKVLFAILFFALIVMLVNFSLSLLGLEKYDKEFMPHSSYPIFVPGEHESAGNYVTSSHFQYIFNEQSFPIKKGRGVSRIFVLGGSAAYGWPYTEEYGFTGYLRRALNNYAPGKFEIVNAAAMSYGSHRVLDVLRDVIRLDPDLVIIYSGNNEYVERNVLPEGKANKAAENGVSEKIRAVVGQTNLYKAVRLLIFRTSPKLLGEPSQQEDITDLRAKPGVRRGTVGRSAEIDREVFNNFQKNIGAMKEILVKAGVTGIFCTVPVNVGDWVPTSAPLQFKNEAEAARWRALHAEFEESLSGTPTMQQAELLRAKLDISPNDADSAYNLGQVLMALGEFDHAYEAFVRAKDLDSRPIRALTPFNHYVRSLADPKNRILVADLDESVAAIVRSGKTGGIFLDYCHPTESGHKFVAISLLPDIHQALGNVFELKPVESLIYADTWKEQGKSDRVRAAESYALGFTHFNNAMYAEAEKAFLQVISLSPKGKSTFVGGAYDNLGYIYEATGDMERSKAMFFKALELDPGNPRALSKVGGIYLKENNLEKAEAAYKSLIALNPYAPDAFEGLGHIALQRNMAKEAISQYQSAVRLGGDNRLIQEGLHAAYLALGDQKNAAMAEKAALQFDPVRPVGQQ